MYIVVGLGNPGRKYDGTRHNVGFDAIDILAQRNDMKVNKLKFRAFYTEGFLGRNKVILAKPQTYMNLSGESIRDMVEYYKINPENLIIIYDDIDLDVGALRIRTKGSSGSHNGMKSIIYQLNSQEFPRIRIGIGKPEYGDLADYVLGKFPKNQIPTIGETIEKAALAVETIVKKGIDLAMNQYNGWKEEQ